MDERADLLVASAGPPNPRDPGLSLAERAAALVAGIQPGFVAESYRVSDPLFSSVLSGSQSDHLDAVGLPQPMRHELAWWIAAGASSGAHRLDMGAWPALLVTAERVTQDRGTASFIELGMQDWLKAWASGVYARRGCIPSASARAAMTRAMRPFLSALEVAYSPAEWWRHDMWDPSTDARIPQRQHEPRGAQPIRFSGLSPAWLAEGMRYYFHLRLETGQWSWTTLHTNRRNIDTGLADYLAERAIEHPALCAEPDRQLRPLALDLASFLRSRPGRRGRVLLPETIRRCMEAVGSFYAFMADYRAEAAQALGDPRWLALTDAHGRLWRAEEIGRVGRALGPADEASYIADADLSKMFARIELVGLPRDQTMTVVVDNDPVQLAGMGDPSAMRAWILQALTGRRASEIMMMDFNPLEQVPGLDPAGLPEGAMVARLRYAQTKIDGAPDTILVGSDVVQVVGEQQGWVRERFGLGEDGQGPCLFPALANNALGLRPRSAAAYLGRLGQLDHLVRLHDQQGHPLSFSKSHRLRHTKATTLLNAGAPIHVVQRYMGHRSPGMTMRYAQTLAITAEREFLALAKVGRDGRELSMDHQDLLELVSLDRRTDRILPNGYCLLPPTKSCDKGNACHTCDHFATDRSYLGEITRQLAETEALVATRNQAHLARHGEAMSETNVWLAERVREMEAMRREIAALESQPAGGGVAVRGAGVLARPGYQGAGVAVALRHAPGGPTP